MEKKNQTEKKRNKWEGYSFTVGILSLITGLLFCPAFGVSSGIPTGIFAIACGILSREEGYPARARVGMAFGIVGIIFGFIWFLLMLYSGIQTQNPETATRILEIMEQWRQMMPQQNIR